MRLIGSSLSPFVRRVGVSLNQLGIAFEHDPVGVFAKPSAVRKYNPVVRVPTLVLDDGEALIDSAAILDEIDQMVGPRRALMPAKGPARRQAMKLTAIAVGASEKAVAAFYEGRFHPAEKVHQPWVDHNDGQAVGGFAYLNKIARGLGEGEWLAGTPKLSQADITAATGFAFAHRVRPGLNLPRRMPALAKLARRLEALPAFQAMPLPE
ncbi:MAG: glutathione S-transferase family protein [Alphaproteobacteria bacterium]